MPEQFRIRNWPSASKETLWFRTSLRKAVFGRLGAVQIRDPSEASKCETVLDLGGVEVSKCGTVVNFRDRRFSKCGTVVNFWGRRFSKCGTVVNFEGRRF